MTTYSYDATGRLTQRSYPTGNPVTFTYDALGRRTAMIDPSGRTTYTYDAAGRLTVQVAPGAKAITYAYDAVGNRATMVDPDGGTTTCAYDARNGLTSLVNPLQERTTWQYDAVGRMVTLTHANGATAGYSYNAAGWVTSLVNAKSSAVTITSHAYSYDAVGNPVGMTEANADVLTGTYDALSQLTREQRSGDNAYDLTYAYDAVGNRLTKLTGGVTTTYTYDAASELTLEDAGGTLTTYSYDENGNTLVWNASGSRTTLTWGYEDEVLTVRPASGDPVTMVYDGDHMRRKREEGAATAKYLWDGAQILMDLDGSDATVARYTLAPFGYGDLLSQRRSNATSFYHFDSLGSTRALTESDEDISDTYVYDAWGVLAASTGSTTNPYRYVGKLGYACEDALLGALLRSRYYQYEVGRFISAAPYLPDLEHPYTYATNRPLDRADPAGRFPKLPEYRWCPANSIICNWSSDQCVIAYSPPAHYEVLHPGQCTSWFFDYGDFAFWSGEWFKCGGGRRCFIDDTPPGQYPPGGPPHAARRPVPIGVCMEYWKCMSASKVNTGWPDVQKCTDQCSGHRRP